MSRSNPYKLKPQCPRVTVLAIGEGHSDAVFLDYLKSLYVVRGCGLSVTVANTYGGGPSAIILEALKVQTRGSFDRSFVLMDTDIEWPKAEVELAGSRNLVLFGSKPCLEGLWLDIIDPSTLWMTCSSKTCKAAWKDRYFDSTKAVRLADLVKSLPMNAIEAARKRISILDDIIRTISIV